MKRTQRDFYFRNKVLKTAFKHKAANRFMTGLFVPFMIMFSEAKVILSSICELLDENLKNNMMPAVHLFSNKAFNKHCLFKTYTLFRVHLFWTLLPMLVTLPVTTRVMFHYSIPHSTGVVIAEGKGRFDVCWVRGSRKLARGEWWEQAGAETWSSCLWKKPSKKAVRCLSFLILP